MANLFLLVFLQTNTGSMKKLLLFTLIICLIDITSESQTGYIVPSPLQVQTLPGEFAFSTSTMIIAPDSLRDAGVLFAGSTMGILGYNLSLSGKGEGKGNILLSIDKSISNAEGYELNISASMIEIKAFGDGKPIENFINDTITEIAAKRRDNPHHHQNRLD